MIALMFGVVSLLYATVGRWRNCLHRGYGDGFVSPQRNASDRIAA